MTNLRIQMIKTFATMWAVFFKMMVAKLCSARVISAEALVDAEPTFDKPVSLDDGNRSETNVQRPLFGCNIGRCSGMNF